jgi:hypothetical protein
VKCEAPPPEAPGPLASTLEDDAASSPTTATHDRILVIDSLSLVVERKRPPLTDPRQENVILSQIGICQFHRRKEGGVAQKPQLLTVSRDPVFFGPPKVAQAFVRDMRAFFKAKNQLKQDEIASRQLHALWAFRRPREKKLRLADVKAMFVQMKDHV